ncbi:epimerase family protein SDR39U1 [Grus japonensis]|uniref:Epimerase family protein SDR39U1 n=1 Tax=Grus japonensis TaxID=30415 RepID=A0ABC9WS21_GRUJA
MPAGSKMDPLMAKAEPISDGGSTSGITELRRGEKKQEELQPERGVRRCDRNNSAGTKVSAEGGAGGTPGTGAEIPMVKTMVRQAAPLQPMEVHGGTEADTHLQPMEDPTPEQVEAPEGGCDPVGGLEQAPGRTCGPVERGAHARAGLLAGLVTPWGTHAGTVCS